MNSDEKFEKWIESMRPYVHMDSSLYSFAKLAWDARGEKFREFERRALSNHETLKVIEHGLALMVDELRKLKRGGE